RQHVPESQRAMSMGLGLLILLVPLQILLGDAHGLNTLEHQPVKIAAMEGLWETQARAPAVLFALPDATSESNRFEIAIPGLASFYLLHDVNGVVKGLKAFPPEDRPPVGIVFWAFRVMAGMGVLMLAVVTWGVWLRWRGRLFASPAFLFVCNFMAPVGFVAVLAGWTVTEVGRQPWVVYGLLRTRDAVSPSITGLDVLLSLLLYMAVYAVIFSAGLYYLFRIARAGPPTETEARDAKLSERPARPLSAADA
ncbi:MAG TPA: cytochrome ubiquinol oxidase subunit I, partial [Casimicrobiaceae bacterium]